MEPRQARQSRQGVRSALTTPDAIRSPKTLGVSTFMHWAWLEACSIHLRPQQSHAQSHARDSSLPFSTGLP